MNNLEDKYLQGNISAKEVELLHKMVEGESDDVVADRMCERWLHAEVDTSEVEDKELDLIWTEVYHKTQTKDKSEIPGKVWKWIQIAAVILLPIMILCSIYFYQKHNLISSDDIVMATGNGERARITLPDGSCILLNQNSTLRYNPHAFNKSQRLIDFDGEGYFDISKDNQHPFFIHGDRLDVQVRGTKFNLFSRKEERNAFLALEEGSVALTTTKGEGQVSLIPDQKATLDKETGCFMIENIEGQFQDITAWRRQEMVFHNTSLREVIKTIEKTYGVNIEVKGDINLNDLYTGTMSASNINVNLEILERLYHIKATMYGKEIILGK